MIHFTHNDLDALGCMLCVHTKFVIKNVYFTNYADFEDRVNDVLKDPDPVLIISDLSFAERPELLKLLISSKKFVFLIDHHSYSEGFWNDFNYPVTKFKKNIDPSMCAAKACYKLLELNNENLKNLIEIIDSYDRWVLNSELFERAQILNDWFWENHLTEIFKALKENDFKLPDSYKEESQKIEEKLNVQMQNAYDLKLVQKFGPVVFVIGTDVFNRILLKEMSSELPVVVQILGTVFKVRIKKDRFSDFNLEKIRFTLAQKVTGHLCAFSYKSNLPVQHECKRIVETILEYI